MCHKERLRHTTCGHRGSRDETVWRFCRKYGFLKRTKPRPCHRYDDRQAAEWRVVNWCCSCSCCDSTMDLDPLYEEIYRATRALQQAEFGPKRNRDAIRERQAAFEDAVGAIDKEVGKHERCKRKRREYFSEDAQFE